MYCFLWPRDMDCVRFWVPIEQRIIVHHLHACWCHVWWQLRERLVEARGSVLVPGSQPKLGLGLSAFSSSPYETIGQQVKMHAFQKKQILCCLSSLQSWTLVFIARRNFDLLPQNFNWIRALCCLFNGALDKACLIPIPLSATLSFEQA